MARLPRTASLLGLLLFVSALALLGLSGRHDPAPPLEVVLTAEPPALAARVTAQQPVRLEVAGRVLPPQGPLPLATLGPGLHTASWSVRYLGQAPLRASTSFLYGAPPPADSWLAGAARLSLSQELFDDGRGGGLAAALSPLLAAELKKQAALARWIGEVRQVHFGLRLQDGALALSLVAELQSAARQAQLQLAARLAPRLREGRLVLAPTGPVVGRIRGDYRSSLLQAAVQALDLLLDVNLADRQLSRQAEELLSRLLPRLSAALSRLLLDQRTLPLPELPLRLRWRPAQLALVTQDALHLLFDVAVELADGSRPAPGRSQQIPALGGPLSCRPLGASSDASARLELRADLFNRASQLLWQHGLLEPLLARLDPAQSLTPRRLRRLLSFEITRFDFGLPPTLMQWQPEGALLAVGELGARLRPLGAASGVPGRIRLQGRSRLQPRLDRARNQLILTAQTAPLAISCGDGSPARPLRPCLTSLAGVANALLAQAPPARLTLPLAPLFSSFALTLGQQRLTLEAQPQQLTLQGRPDPALRADLSLQASVQPSP